MAIHVHLATVTTGVSAIARSNALLLKATAIQFTKMIGKPKDDQIERASVLEDFCLVLVADGKRRKGLVLTRPLVVRIVSMNPDSGSACQLSPPPPPHGQFSDYFSTRHSQRRWVRADWLIRSIR